MKRIALISLLVASVAIAAEPVPRITGVYSNMHFAGEDVIGAEVFIVLTRGGYHASVQCSEGEPGIPEVVPVTVTGSSISFRSTTKQSGCPNSMFHGVISNAGLAGTFEGTNYPGMLKRGKSYWQ